MFVSILFFNLISIPLTLHCVLTVFHMMRDRACFLKYEQLKHEEKVFKETYLWRDTWNIISDVLLVVVLLSPVC